MTSLGETLRRARIERNLELNRIADELKISASMLKAIEEERFDKLPGGVFARSFVRQYARLLKVDEHEVEGALTRALEGPTDALPASQTGHVPDSEIPLPRMSGWEAIGDQGARWSSSAWALVLMVLVMLACAGAYAWWQRERHPVVAHVQTSVTAPQAAPVASAPSPPAAPAPAPIAAAAPAENVPAPQTASPAPTSAPAGEGPDVAVAANAAANPDAPVRVEVEAQEQTWISVRTDGQFSFSGVLEANQSRTVAGNRNVLLKIGNAGGVSVRFNGKSIGPLGAKGTVRTIQFTSGGFQIVPPEPNPPIESLDPL
jgi:cytoskeleton protein RodZ